MSFCSWSQGEKYKSHSEDGIKILVYTLVVVSICLIECSIYIKWLLYYIVNSFIHDSLQISASN